MKILYIGSVEFSLRALEKIISLGGEVVGICTRKESSFNSDHCDLGLYSKKMNIPCNYIDDINSARSIKWMSSIGPDIIFCFGWSQLLGEEVRSIAPMGVLGFHPAALPANRGRHPIIWALSLGLDKTASTFFFIDGGVDSGDILSQISISINDSDDARTLYNKVITTSFIQIEQFLPRLISGVYSVTKQENDAANVWRRRTIKDGLVDWRMSSFSIHNMVRALAKPYVGAEFEYKNIRYKLWKTGLYPCVSQNIEPGKVIETTDSSMPIIKCGDNAIKLIETEPKLVIAKGSYL